MAEFAEAKAPDCARVITGIGTGQLNALVPVWTSELSHHSGRGAAMGFEFMLNIAGLATAYWIEFGLREANQSLRWRLPLAMQVGFLVVLLILVPLFPESPRWLAKMGRNEDARQILSVLRCKKDDSPEELAGRVELELQGIIETVQEERKQEEKGMEPQECAITYWSMLVADDPQHLRRRTWLIIWLQIMQELVGIGVVTVYAPTVFQQAGYSEYKADLLSGFNDISYMFSVIVAIVTLDRMGRRITLYWGAILMGLSLLICGIAARYVTDTALSITDRQTWGSVVTAFVTTLHPALLSKEMLSLTGFIPQHNSFTLANCPMACPYRNHAALCTSKGWMLECGRVVQTAGRSLEDMDVLFESDSIFIHKTKHERTEKLVTSS
ncbi:hypothetical protein VP01_264g9 [Puccinia sorghi]|uniref:Major facilitator superfamily (MFS) profile domain-containing protein n=1 Tax=Puccinia sorghi TaxID=27349 RepID=A0A0L6V4W4_9BASI|nr:hypothetical protein VP01_264g9 [Puccinia sorghi]